MLKRERTSEEKKIDILIKRGIMRLGQPTAKPAARPNAFTHYLYRSIKGRKGQRVRVLKLNANLQRYILIGFEDGTEMVVDRQAIRRLREDPCSPSSSSSSSPSSSSR
jgi:hypothetical protein